MLRAIIGFFAGLFRRRSDRRNTDSFLREIEQQNDRNKNVIEFRAVPLEALSPTALPRMPSFPARTGSCARVRCARRHGAAMKRAARRSFSIAETKGSPQPCAVLSAAPKGSPASTAGTAFTTPLSAATAHRSCGSLLPLPTTSTRSARAAECTCTVCATI